MGQTSQPDCPPDIAQAKGGSPSIDAGTGTGVWIVRLEDEIGSTRLREVRDVLPRATRDLKNQAAQRQVALQHLKYRFSVAGYGRCVASGILCHIWFAA